MLPNVRPDSFERITNFELANKFSNVYIKGTVSEGIKWYLGFLLL